MTRMQCVMGANDSSKTSIEWRIVTGSTSCHLAYICILPSHQVASPLISDHWLSTTQLAEWPLVSICSHDELLVRFGINRLPNFDQPPVSLCLAFVALTLSLILIYGARWSAPLRANLLPPLLTSLLALFICPIAPVAVLPPVLITVLSGHWSSMIERASLYLTGPNVHWFASTMATCTCVVIIVRHRKPPSTVCVPRQLSCHCPHSGANSG